MCFAWLQTNLSHCRLGTCTGTDSTRQPQDSAAKTSHAWGCHASTLHETDHSLTGGPTAQGHVSRRCPDRAAGPILPSQLGAWGRGGDPNPALKVPLGKLARISVCGKLVDCWPCGRPHSAPSAGRLGRQQRPQSRAGDAMWQHLCCTCHGKFCQIVRDAATNRNCVLWLDGCQTRSCYGQALDRHVAPWYHSVLNVVLKLMPQNSMTSLLRTGTGPKTCAMFCLQGAKSSSMPHPAPEDADATQTATPRHPTSNELADRDQQAAEADVRSFLVQSAPLPRQLHVL